MAFDPPNRAPLRRTPRRRATIETVRITIRGRDLPGARFLSDGALLEHVHVGVQVGKEPSGLVAGDAPGGEWQVDVRPVAGGDGQLDLRGDAVHGRKGERFLYLTWGDVGADGSFTMFRRAKLMVTDIPADLLSRAAAGEGQLVAGLGLTDARGGPLCARVRPPAILWSLDDRLTA
jgi:hypothetical protein